MDGSGSGCSWFRIDSLLSPTPLGALPPELSPRSSSSCSAPPTPRRERVPRVESPPLPGPLQQLQPRTVSSSFLIRDILADRSSFCDPGQEELEELEAEPSQSGADEDYQNKSLSSEFRGGK